MTLVAPFAGAGHLFPVFTLRWKHVVIHADHHGDEYDGVVEEVEFHTWKNQLQNAARHRFAPEIVVKCGLPDQQEMLDVMPELDHEGCRPPLPRNPSESSAQYPKADEHDQGVAIMQSFGLDQPGIPHTKNAIGLRARPSHDVNLISLDQMLAPVCEHNNHKALKRTLMPAGVQLVVKARARGVLNFNVFNTWSRNRRKVLPCCGNQSMFALRICSVNTILGLVTTDGKVPLLADIPDPRLVRNVNVTS